MKKRAVVFTVWGDKFIKEVLECINFGAMPDIPKILITDQETNTTILDNLIEVIKVDFEFDGLMRKTEIFQHLPKKYDTFLFLDCEARILEDIDFGFQQAEQHSLALVQAPHYSLEYFYGFDKVMELENVPFYGQAQYNTGVIFFELTPEVISLFDLWYQFCKKYYGLRDANGNDVYINNDQPFLTLAIEQMGFLPYTLSKNYNYREFDDLISGKIRIWHSYYPVPEGLNVFEHAWPPRRSQRGILERL